MSTMRCATCGCRLYWRWQNAFDKFGYNDGDGLIETPTIVGTLEAAGYRCKTSMWGLHNTVITSIESPDGEELIPATATVGYDDPRDYLPAALVSLLDRAHPALEEVDS